MKVLEVLHHPQLPSSSGEVREEERGRANAIFPLMKKLEDATIAEILEDEDLMQILSEYITDVEPIYEMFNDTVANENFPFEYVKNVIEAKEKGRSLETIMNHFRRVKDRN